jgi:putative transposase
VYVPKVGWVRIRQSREVEGATKSATFKRCGDGHWYVTLTVEFEMPDVALPSPDPAKAVGIDLGLKDFAVTSEGEKTEAPKFYRKGQAKIRKAQRAVSRRQKGSRRREKAKKRLSKIHQRGANQRNDFLHKLSRKLVNQHQAICIEDLNVKGLARTKLSRSFADAAMGEFRRQLEYKCLWNRKHLIVIGRFYPSSKTCNQCGAINDNLTLSDRSWSCGCGVVIDRDLNAAMNIRDEGLRNVPRGTREHNARGDRVRPATAGCGR